jgi:predicted porin
MKKTLIAAAALAVSGAAMAQSSVEIYGTVDLWVGSVKAETNSPSAGKTSTRLTVMEPSGLSTSNIGFRGTEDLGGGLSAKFQLEAEIGADTGAGLNNGFGRGSWVGLAGGFGEVQLGKNWTAYDDYLFGLISNFSSTFGFIAAPAIGYNFIPDNTIKYISPEFGGVTFAFTHSLGETKPSSNVTSFSVNYASGPFTVGLAHQTEKNPAVEIYGFGIPVPADKLNNTVLGGSYDLGMAKLTGSFNRAKVEDVGGDIKLNEYQIGVEVPLADNLTAAVGFGSSKAKSAGIKLIKATGFATSIKYDMSKRTSLYAGYGQQKFTDQVGLVEQGASVKATVLAVGLNHSF